MESLQGRRLPDLRFGELHSDVRAGDYWKILGDDGLPRISFDSGNLTRTCWYIVAPMSYGFAIGRLTKHTVREHEDGTISVRPNDGSSNSILITGHRGEQWHGYIEKGVWLKS